MPILEFIASFLLHVLPNGMRHIRHFGFLTNNQRKKRLAEIRERMGVTSVPEDDDATDEDSETDPESGFRCPECGEGEMAIDEEWSRPTVAQVFGADWADLDCPRQIQNEFW